MSRYKGPACKICRRNGAKLLLKGARCHTAKCAMETRNFPPGLRGMRRRLSDYGIRLREKQKLRYFYGVTEGQMRIYFKKASNQKGVTGYNLLKLFETRLDNIVYKSGLVNSRKEARQLVLHNHFLINGKKANIPSMLVKEGDQVGIKNSGSNLFTKKVEEIKEYVFPEWMEFEAKSKLFKIKRIPKVEEIDSPVEMQLIVEYYSR